MSLGGPFQALSLARQGQIAAAQGKFEEKIQEQNQQALERQATAERVASKVEESRIARRSRIVQARLAAGQSKSGVGVAGASLDALADAAFQFSLDRNLTLRSGLIKSRELVQRGKILRSQGQFARIIGKQKRASFFLSAVGSLLGASGGTPSTDPPKSSQPASPQPTGQSQPNNFSSFGGFGTGNLRF